MFGIATAQYLPGLNLQDRAEAPVERRQIGRNWSQPELPSFGLPAPAAEAPVERRQIGRNWSQPEIRQTQETNPDQNALWRELMRVIASSSPGGLR